MQPNLTAEPTEERLQSASAERMNPYFELAQLKKAVRLADVLSALGISSVHASLMSESERGMIASLAGETAPRTSWPVTLELLRNRESATDKFSKEREVLQCS